MFNQQQLFGARSLSTVLAVLAATQAHADTVGHLNITPTSSLIPEAAYPLSMISDGITSSPNGFVTNSVGVITFTFDQDYDLNSFILWNDVVVNNEGIDEFTLRFFDATDTIIAVPFSTAYVGPVGQTTEEIYAFPTPVNDVRKVELDVATTQFNYPGPIPRIEIREVDFGVVPEPSTAALLCLGALAIYRRRQSPA